MAEAGAPAIADGTRRALFRVLAPGTGGHHYATLREHGEGPTRFTLEVRRGLVWSFTEPVLVVRGEASEGGGLVLSVAGASGPGESVGRVRGGDLAAFASEALRIAAGRLGVEAGAFEAATHVDLGESGTLGVEAPVRQRSSELIAAMGERLAEARHPSAAGTAAPTGASAPGPGGPSLPTAAPEGDRRVSSAPAPPGAAAEAERTVPSTPRPSAGPEPTVRPAPRPATAAERPVAAAPTSPAAGTPAAREEQTARSPGLLGRFVGWLRRAARAAFGR